MLHLILDKRLVFIYDGECPFCNQFAELLELKSNLPNIQVKDARNNPPEIPKEYDIDIKGALLLYGNEMLSGSDAINFICGKIKTPSAPLLSLLKLVFKSHKRTAFIFPFLLHSRRVALFFKGVSRKIN